MKVGLRSAWMALVLCMASPVLAAPLPGTGSSKFVSEYNQLFRSRYGFSIHSGSTDWALSEPPRGMPNLVTLFKAPRPNRGVQPALTVRVDQLKKQTPLKPYVKKWMKDYHRFGFDVLLAKPVKVSGQYGFLLDVLNRETQKQLRQVVFLKSQTAVILTCRDHKESFNRTVDHCNEIIRSFQWNR